MRVSLSSFHTKDISELVKNLENEKKVPNVVVKQSPMIKSKFKLAFDSKENEKKNDDKNRQNELKYNIMYDEHSHKQSPQTYELYSSLINKDTSYNKSGLCINQSERRLIPNCAIKEDTESKSNV